MKPTYLDAGKLAWYPDIACPVCGGDVNSWDKRCSRALGYRQIVCEGCISEEYQVTVENLRYVMENHFGLVPCPGITQVRRFCLYGSNACPPNGAMGQNLVSIFLGTV